jgi:hypothetical protein
MPRLPVFVFAVAALALAASADAQVYKWKDANGVVHYSDAPPQNGKYEQVRIYSNVSTTARPAAPAATPAASTNSGGSSQGDPSSTGPMADTPDNRSKLCQQLDANVALLSSDSPVADPNATKPGQNLSDAQRQQALANAKAQQQTFCSSKGS